MGKISTRSEVFFLKKKRRNSIRFKYETDQALPHPKMYKEKLTKKSPPLAGGAVEESGIEEMGAEEEGDF